MRKPGKTVGVGVKAVGAATGVVSEVGTLVGAAAGFQRVKTAYEIVEAARRSDRGG